MAFPASRRVNALGVAHVQRLQRPMQTIAGCRNSNQVNVIGHQAICEHFNMMFVAVLSEPRQICFAIFVGEKKYLPADCPAASRDGEGPQILLWVIWA